MPAKFHVCQGSSCVSQGAPLLLRDIEELCHNSAEAAPYGCLGRCGKGPNVEVEDNGAKKIKEGLKTFHKVTDLVGDKVSIPSLDKDVAKLKYNLRREDDPKKQQELFGKAFALLGADAKASAAQHPWLYSTLLVLRSGTQLKASPQEALADAEWAASLEPKWPQSYLACANAQEVLGQAKAAAEHLNKALQIGRGIEVRTLRRQMQRLERKAEQQATEQGEQPIPAGEGSERAISEPSSAAPVKVPEQPGKVESKSKDVPGGATQKSSSKSKAAESKSSAKTGKSKKQSEPLKAEAPPGAESKAKTMDLSSVPEFIPWTLEEVHRLNYNCMLIRLRLRDQPELAGALCQNLSNIWHVQLKIRLPDGEDVIRSYTPASGKAALAFGCIDLMIKIYPDGKMTQHLATLRAPSTVLVSKPHSTLEVEDFPDGALMVAGGSAVTVALQVCEAVCESLQQNSKSPDAGVHLVLCNHQTVDVLFARRFLELQSMHQHRLKVVHCISHGPLPIGDALGEATWRAGRLTAAAMPSNARWKKLPAVVSGPPGLCRSAFSLLTSYGVSHVDIEVLDGLAPEESNPGESSEPAATGGVQPPKESLADKAIAETTDRGGSRTEKPTTALASWLEVAWTLASSHFCQGGGAEGAGDGVIESPGHRYEH
mmetsp:Transcript_42027/g.96508  ORF Transcript_42027/g.96508 Transcript_42027/m.96508 type:complete len:656 (+) Transcript_42027:78-2045(+)